MARAVSQTKKTGATFTPEKLADYLAKEIGKFVSFQDGQMILDPACGDGELLMAIGKSTKAHLELVGFDLNHSFVEDAKLRVGASHLQIEQGDFIEKDLNGDQRLFDVIIANPPYVRTQVLGGDRAQFLAKKYNLKGRVDLYYPFLIAMTNHLKVGGVIGVLTSNKYLFTKSGKSIRDYLSRNYEVLRVIDLGDTKLFPNAAVLPAIFIGRKKLVIEKKQLHETDFLKIYEFDGEGKQVKSLYDILDSKTNGVFTIDKKSYKKTTGVLNYYSNSDEVWSMMTEEESNWAKNIEENSFYRISDFFKVRVGIKSNNDPVFIRKDWDDLKDKPEPSLLKQLISSHDFDRWNKLIESKNRVLYPHFFANGTKGVIDLKDYPKAKKYLTPFKSELEERIYLIQSGRHWYELWVPQNPMLWPKGKLIFPDISDSAKFYYDESGAVVNGNCYWISSADVPDPELIFLVQGICNSELIARYHDLKFNNRLYAGRRRYFSQYVENYPLPNPSSKISTQIIAVVKELNNSNSRKEMEKLEKKLNKYVYAAFSTSPMEDGKRFVL